MKELSHYGPSLCVKFYGNHVFAGYGPYIHIYNYVSGKKINECRVFQKNKVHHIVICESGYALLCGMKSLSIVRLDNLMDSKSVLENEKMIPECITSGEFSYDFDQVYLLNCYNEVIIIDLEGNVLSKKAVYSERSILYSGSIKVLSRDRVYINAGTVMGGVLIWDLFTEKTIHNLLGHVGSIFHVVLSDDVKYVASCSDDRSIRIWDFETGKELCIGWGHTARIWQLKFFDGNKNLISISEDCTCRLWSITAESENRIEILQQNIYEVHLSKNAWSVDVHAGDMIAVSTGNDGRIKLTDLKQLSRYGDEEACFSLENISASADIEFKRDEIIKGFHIYEFGVVAITSQGNVLTYNREKNWEYLFNDSRFISYSYTNGLSDRNIVIFSNNTGNILILKFANGNMDVISKTEFEINDLSKINNCMVCVHDSLNFMILLESPNPNDNMLCLIINSSTLQLERKITLAKPENFTSSCVEVYQNFLLVGSRFSTLAIYDLNVSKLLCIVRRINPGDTTTSIKYIETVKGQAIFSLTNRDGYYNFIKINFDERLHENKISVSIIHSNKIVRGFLEDAYMDKNGDYIIHGFKSNLFYIYNETKGYEIASQVCGGAHRQWKLCSTKKSQVFVYIKASKLFFRRFHTRSIPDTLRDGIHGREIRDITIKKDQIYNNGYLFCTGSEDTSIKLCHFEKCSGKITNYWTQRKHVSGLQRCSFINKSLLISSSAREELFLWEVNTDSSQRPFMKLLQTLPTSTANPDLRIMDFSVQFIKDDIGFIMATVYSDSAIKIWFYNSKKNTFELIVDGKYETCCLLNVELIQYYHRIYLAITPTDGHLVFYNITKSIPFKLEKSNGELVDIQLDIIPSNLPDAEFKLPIHQSGIKTVTSAINSHGNLNFYTGGDDNAIAISSMNIDKSTGRMTGRITAFSGNAAASTITSCGMIRHDKLLMTTSVDQIVKVWDITSDKLRLHDSQYVSVADTGSSDFITNEDGSISVLIGGVGFSIYKECLDLD